MKEVIAVGELIQWAKHFPHKKDLSFKVFIVEVLDVLGQIYSSEFIEAIVNAIVSLLFFLVCLTFGIEKGY